MPAVNDPIGGYPTSPHAAYRESSARILRARAEQLRLQAEGLDRLAVYADAFLLGDAADEALWSLVIHGRNS